MKGIPDILAKIVAHKAEEVSQRSNHTSLTLLQERVQHAAPTRDFYAAINNRIGNGEPAIIAEIKKASPSKGVIRSDFDPPAIARSYEIGGAACLSVLTDVQFFKGEDSFLAQSRAVTELPVLRKDFMIDPYQIWESRAIGADCILLIAAALNDAQLSDFYQLANELDMAVLMEVHDRSELERVLKLECPLIGINNRDLRTFKTTLDTTLELLPVIPEDRTVVTESGIHLVEDVNMMRRHQVNAFLVGESFMRAADPGDKLRTLFFSEPNHRGHDE